MVRHIVFWKIKDDENKQVNLEKMREDLLTLTNKINGIISAEVGFNFSSSDYDIILDVIFENPFALKQYQSHPDNIALKKYTESILVDCVASDYMIDPADSVRKKDTTSMMSDSMPNSQERAPIARVNKNSDKKRQKNTPNRDVYNDEFNRDFEEDASYNRVRNEALRQTLAHPLVLDDSAFALGSDNEYQRNNFNNMGNTQMMRKKPQGMRNTGNIRKTGPLKSPYMDDEPFDMQRDGRWTCPKCGRINDPSVNTCTCGRRRPVMQAGQPNKNMIQKSQTNMLVNSGVLPNINETQNMKMKGPGMSNTGIVPLQQGQSNDSPWKCPQCGKNNSPFDNVCSCGLRRNSMKQGPMNRQNHQMNNRQNPYGNSMEMNQAPKRKANKRNQPQDMQMSMEGNFNRRANEPWICPQCGKQNASVVGRCGCGQKKPQGMFAGGKKANLNGTAPIGNFAANQRPDMNDDMGYYDDNEFDETMPPNNGPIGRRGRRADNGPAPRNTDVDSWKCPRCGKINGNFVGQCGCGQRKPARNMNRRGY